MCSISGISHGLKSPLIFARVAFLPLIGKEYGLSVKGEQGAFLGKVRVVLVNIEVGR